MINIVLKIVYLLTGLTGKYDPRIGCLAVFEAMVCVPVASSSRSSSIGTLVNVWGVSYRKDIQKVKVSNEYGFDDILVVKDLIFYYDIWNQTWGN